MVACGLPHFLKRSLSCFLWNHLHRGKGGSRVTHLEAIKISSASVGSCLDQEVTTEVMGKDQSLDLFLKVEQVTFGDRLDLS